MRSVGLVGIGIMGSAMSAHLIDRKYEVMGYDVSSTRLDALRDRGGSPVESIGELVSRSDVLITSLPTVAAAEAVLTEISSCRRRDLTVIETSTLPLSMRKRASAGVPRYRGDSAGLPVERHR